MSLWEICGWRWVTLLTRGDSPEGNQQVKVNGGESQENIAENKNLFRISFQFTAVISPSEEKGLRRGNSERLFAEADYSTKRIRSNAAAGVQVPLLGDEEVVFSWQNNTTEGAQASGNTPGTYLSTHLSVPSVGRSVFI